MEKKKLSKINILFKNFLLNKSNFFFNFLYRETQKNFFLIKSVSIFFLFYQTQNYLYKKISIETSLIRLMIQEIP